LLRAPEAAESRSTAPPSVEDFVRALESSYRGVRTLRAEFTQTHAWGGRTRTESGTVSLARGGNMRWEYRQPQAKTFLTNRRYSILYVPEDKRVIRSPVKSSEDLRVPFRLLLSRLDLGKVFAKIEFADRALPAEEGNRVLRGVPKESQEQNYREVLMEVTPSFDISRLVVFYADRSRMEFTFEKIERNVALSLQLFDFSPPPGSEVIDQR
jgi:outer membrane lipoprotein-sorting protein